MRHVPEMPERKEQRFAVGEAPAVQRQGFNPETNMKRGSLFFQGYCYGTEKHFSVPYPLFLG